MLQACSAKTTPSWTTLSEGLRVDLEGRVTEFEARVAVDAHHPNTPDVYLELVACMPDSREHESLVVTEVPASLIHAALLAAGHQPGMPGNAAPNAPTPPSGSALTITLITTDDQGKESAVPPSAWITDVQTRSRRPDENWVFSGSRLVRHQGRSVYDADHTGTVIGLATFGSELIAWTTLFSPHADIDRPEWIADNESIPPRGTPVRVRISPIGTGSATLGTD